MRRLGFAVAVSSVVALGVLATTHPAVGQGEGAVWALLVGINDYESDEISDLKYAVADVQAFRGLLSSPRLGSIPEDNLVLMVDGAPGRLRPVHTSVFYQLDVLANKVKPQDSFFLYFSGHGLNREGHNYLLTANADSSTIEGLELSSIPLEKLKAKMEKIPARRMFFIIDACRNDPTSGRGDKDNPLTQEFVRGIQVMPKLGGGEEGGPAGVATLYACNVGERAYEWADKQHGVFSYFLLEGLKGKAADPLGEITANSLAEYVQKQVRDWTRENPQAAPKKQTPWLDQSGAARLLLAKVKPLEPGGAVTEVATTATLTVESTPPGAQVFLDNTDTGRTTPCELEVDLGLDKRKDVEVGVKLDGHRAKKAVVSLAPGKTTPWRADLQALPSPPTRPTAPIDQPPKPPATRQSGDAAEYEFIPIPAGDGVESFEIGKYEVTVAQFRKFVEATGYKTTAETKGRSTGYMWTKGGLVCEWFEGLTWRNNSWGLKEQAQDDCPVVHVSREDARAFCKWIGGRLPTDAEWEHAARGGLAGKLYIWGDEFPPPKGAGNFADATAARKYPSLYGVIDGYDDGFADTAPVGSFKPNGYGLSDMAGNVLEWIEDRNNGCRGGSFSSNGPDDLRVGGRGGYGDPRSDGRSDGFVGFRAARTL